MNPPGAFRHIRSYYASIVMGDFNTNLLSLESPRSRKLLQIVESSNLHVLPLDPTHHNTAGDDSWLDLILTSNPSFVSCHGQHDAPGFSHHDMIFLSYILKPPKVKPRVLYRRCFARMDGARLQEDASLIDWEPMLEAATVDDKLAIIFILSYSSHKIPSFFFLYSIYLAVERAPHRYQDAVCSLDVQVESSGASFEEVIRGFILIFTISSMHIQDMMTLKESRNENLLNLGNIDDMEDHIVHTWVGLTKAQFRQIFDEVPQLLEIRNSPSVLAAFLIKLRTREIFIENFVPQHLGLGHITRELIKERNLAIPSALFEGDSRPIAITTVRTHVVLAPK
ncbi:hypothetical protein SFRURICE_006467 [Spodoptera frugiperda]|nr:hypothetical protein SFRURICE_006467 [Spodoptera frugiperda]